VVSFTALLIFSMGAGAAISSGKNILALTATRDTKKMSKIIRGEIY